MHPPPFTRDPRALLLAALVTLSAGVAVATSAALFAAQPPPPRKHRSNRSQPITLEPATQPAPAQSRHLIEVAGDTRAISANAIPEHLVGRFPNRGNPHAISVQAYEFALPAQPAVAEKIIWLHQADTGGRLPPNLPFGIAVNGVLFDPGTAEFWQGDRANGWNYEALGGAVPLGLDENHAHVQPSGAYHYHGLPTLLLRELGFAPGSHSPLVGWAADGFPIYAVYGWRDPRDPSSGAKALRSSYRLRSGTRPAAPGGPGGNHDGAFIQDYEYVPGLGDLDECNGRFTVTAEYPDGTYAYFLTQEWPVVPRGFRGRPVVLRGPRPAPSPAGN